MRVSHEIMGWGFLAGSERHSIRKRENAKRTRANYKNFGESCSIGGNDSGVVRDRSGGTKPFCSA
jgi:hypothetical protein